MTRSRLPSSFRDPCGFIFEQNGSLYRQVNRQYEEDYRLTHNSGLYQRLIESHLFLPYEEVNVPALDVANSYVVIRPEPLPFISYPYEWCFDQLKDAALLTLRIEKLALSYGMTLKDSSAFNIQFLKSRPIFIDSLSLERYQEGSTWDGYKQFCQHFLAPLALMSYRDLRCNLFLRSFIDGLPLDLTSRLLPWNSWLNMAILTNIHAHGSDAMPTSQTKVDQKKYQLSKTSLLALIDYLEATINKLTPNKHKTFWGDYYRDNESYTKSAFDSKQAVVEKYLDRLKSKTIWDIGANDGHFSAIASSKGALTIAIDSDPAAVNTNYLNCQKLDEPNMIPLVMDLTNPSPGIGWGNQERETLMERGPADTILALAVIHHFAISNNLPLRSIAEFFQKICKNLIIEFIPKEDAQVQSLLANRRDIFPNYTKPAFEIEFKDYFDIVDQANIDDSYRCLYLMTKRG